MKKRIITIISALFMCTTTVSCGDVAVFDGRALFRTCINGSSELMTNISLSFVSCSVGMFLLDEFLAKPLAMLFVGYDA